MDLNLRGLCLLLLLGPVAGLAQEQAGTDAAARAAEIEAMGPSVGSEDLAASGDEDEKVLAAPTAVLATDVKRDTSGNRVMDELELGRTEITGNQELPTVMYIVPWQKSDPGELMGRPVNTLLDEIMAPIDRSEFMRQVEYFGDLHPKDEN
jgi:hypothetical protein